MFCSVTLVGGLGLVVVYFWDLMMVCGLRLVISKVGCFVILDCLEWF